MQRRVLPVDEGRVWFGSDSVERLVSELVAVGAERVAVVCTSTRDGGAQTLAAALGPRCVGIIARARPHVPQDLVDAATLEVRETGTDWLIAHGGGTAMGLAKAVALSLDVRLAAIPTTYAGSEMTNIYGITTNGTKTTGRDDRVRPKLVAYDPALLVQLPLKTATASVLNALAHSVEALYGTPRPGWVSDVAERACRLLYGALPRLNSPDGYADGLFGAYLAGKVLDAAPMGAQHKLAHTLGGSFDVAHHAAHAILLPHVMAANLTYAPDALARLRRAFACHDPATALWDRASEVGAPLRLRDAGFEQQHIEAAVSIALTMSYPNPRPLEASWLRPLLQDAVLGRRPGMERRTVRPDATRGASGVHASPKTLRAGVPLAGAQGAIILLHGRASTAEAIVRSVLPAIKAQQRGIAVLAPQASENTWYPSGFKDEDANAGPRQSAWSVVEALFGEVTEHVAPQRVVVAGFSQGGCLALSWLARKAHTLPGGIAALCGALEPAVESFPLAPDLNALIVGRSEDRWMTEKDVLRSAKILRAAEANVMLQLGNGPHAITAHDLDLLTQLLESTMPPAKLNYLAGFGAHHQTEAVDGALPRRQNSPRHVPHGLYAEAINGTGFTVHRAQNLVTWTYRLRPQIYTGAWERMEQGRFAGDFSQGVVSPELMRFRPASYPSDPSDFVTGMNTFGGAGDPATRTGMAIHTYTATTSMKGRAFVNMDGDMLVVPQDGPLQVRTELGRLRAQPGQLLVLPRGLRYQINPENSRARGWMVELFSGHFQLPERGVIGANGMASERHFLAPVADFEETDKRYEVIQKQGGNLWRHAGAVSPFDVVAWHGNYAPYIYDFKNFMAYGSVSFDHTDPSVLTVLTSPMDTHGRNVVDVAVFKGRWDPTEDTFRPPYFHRNSAVEFNAVVKSAFPDGPYPGGAATYTPYLVPHGVGPGTHQRHVDMSPETANTPIRSSDEELWVQIESAYPLRVMPWVFDHPDRDEAFAKQFEGYQAATLPTTLGD